MRSLSLRLILAILPAVLCGTFPAMAFDIMLDASGSMKGFVSGIAAANGAPGSFSGLFREMQAESAKRGGKTKLFGDRVVALEGVPTRDTLSHENTDLAEAVENWIASGNRTRPLLIITDNVADERAGGDNGQRKFYHSIEKFTFISIVNMRLEFDGRVFAPRSANTGKPQASDYAGKRAIAFYILGSSPQGDRERLEADARNLQKWIVELAGHYSISHGQISLLPIGTDQWRVHSSRKAEVIPGPRRSGGPAIEVGEDNRIRVRDFHLGDDEVGESAFEFKASVDVGGNFILRDVAVDANIDFDPATIPPELRSLRTKLKVTPDRVTFDPSPGRNKVEFTIPVKIGQVGFFDLRFRDQLRFALSDGIVAKGKVTLSYRLAGKEKIDVAKDIISNWDYSGPPEDLGKSPNAARAADRPRDPKVHEKIYQLAALSHGMLPAEQMRNLQEEIFDFPVEVELRFPMGAVFSIFLLGLIGFGLLVFLYLKMMKGAHYVIEDELGQEQAMLAAGLFSSTLFSSPDGQYSGRVTMIGPMFWVSSPNRVRTPKMMFGEGPIDLEAAFEGEPVTHTFRVRRSERSPDGDAEGGLSVQDEWGGNA